MRKIVLFSVLILMSFIYRPHQVSAAVAGEACCPTGSQFLDGACVKNNSPAGEACNITSLFICYNPLSAAACAAHGGFEGYKNLCIKSNTNPEYICEFVRKTFVGLSQPISEFDAASCNLLLSKITPLLGRSNLLCDEGFTCVNDGSDQGVCSLGGQGAFDLCQQAPDEAGKQACQNCVTEKGGIWTAIGCLPTQPTAFIPMIIRLAIGVAGGIALLLMLVGVLTITLAAGNPDKVQEGKERITSAIAGLSLILFAAVLLQVIGVDLLRIPGL